MNTQSTFFVECTSKNALENAYKTLLSFPSPKKPKELHFIDTRTMSAFAVVTYPKNGYDSPYWWNVCCLITIEAVSDLKCKIEVSADFGEDITQSGKGSIICFMAEFIKRFSANLD